MVLVGILDAGFPQLGRGDALVGRDEAVERALRQRQRHVRPRRGVGNAAEETDAPADAGPARAADLQPLDIFERVKRLLRRVPVLEAELEPGPDDLDPQLGLELLVTSAPGSPSAQRRSPRSAGRRTPATGRNRNPTRSRSASSRRAPPCPPGPAAAPWRRSGRRTAGRNGTLRLILPLLASSSFSR